MRRAIDSEFLYKNQECLIMSAAVAAGKTRIDHGYDVADIAKELDFINLMRFRFY